MDNREKQFLNNLTLKLGQEDYDRDSIKSRFGVFRKYMRNRFFFSCPIVIVGGTNGKGSVVKNLAAQARSHGKNIAVWTSPHIESLVERYQYNDEFIDWESLENLINNEIESSTLSFSLFELFFVVFCQWASNLKLDLLILEVGLGGRLDATNVFDSQVSVITSISRDHVQYLGNSYKNILIEKIQIARPKKDLILQTPLKFLHPIAKEQASLIGANLALLEQGKDEGYELVNSRIVKKCWSSLYPKLGFNEEVFLKRVKSWNNLIEFNGAHNSDGMRQLMHSLCQDTCQDKNKDKPILLLAFSQRPSKEVHGLIRIVKAYKHHFSQIKMSFFHHSRSLEESLSRQIAKENAIVFEHNWKHSINDVVKETKPCLVAGSYYFVGEVKSYLGTFNF